MFRNARVVPFGGITSAAVLAVPTVAILAAFFFPHPASATVYIPSSSVTALYHFEDASDSSGNGRNLTASGTAYVTGWFGNAGDTQGTGWFRASSSAMDLSSDFSIGFWINAQATLDDDAVISRRSAGADSIEQISRAQACAAGVLEFVDGTPPCEMQYTTSSPPVGAWQWHLLTRTGSSVEWYVNNTIVTSGSDSDTTNFTTDICVNGRSANVNPVCNAAALGDFHIDELFFMNTRISTSTRNALWNSGSGDTICVTVGCTSSTPPSIGDLLQFKSNGTTSLAEGATTAETSVVLKAIPNSSSTNQLIVQVELATSTSFAGPMTQTSSPVAPGAQASTTVSSITPGSWYWRARAQDTVTFATSSWTQFGTADVFDFTVETDPSPYLQITDGAIRALYHTDHHFAADASGNHYTLTNYGPAATGTGVLGTAADFGTDNTTKYLYASENLGISGGAMSLAAWVKFASIASGDQEIVSVVDSGTDVAYGIEYTGGSTRTLYCQRNRWGAANETASWTNGGNGLATSTWYHVACTFDGTSLRLYVQNDLKAEAAAGSGNGTSAVDTGTGIGAHGGYPSGGGYGKISAMIDEVVVLNRALTAGEVTKLWNSSQGRRVCAQSSGCGGLLSGTIATSTTWSKAEGPYIVSSTVTINAGKTITIEPGTIIKFKPSTSLIVNGELDVQGGALSSTLVYFTSYKDDSVGGDTNGDGGATAPVAGDWGHIQINSGASTTIAGSVVRYGGSTASSTIYVTGGTLNARYTDISYSSDYGIYSTGGATTVTESAIHDNDYGLYITGGTVTVASSTIYNNATSSAWKTGSPTSTMKWNFWGGWYPLDDTYDGSSEKNTSTENAGPWHATQNTSGTGAKISDYIDADNYYTAYLSHPNVNTWSPLAVYTNTSTYVMRVGSSTQYQTQLEDGIDTWNDTTVGYINLEKASSYPNSQWDVAAADITSSTLDWAGLYVPRGWAWFYIPSSTSIAHIYFNTARMGVEMNKQCVTTHELGHALGLAHSPEGNLMDQTCQIGSSQTNLSAQDISDFRLLWTPALHPIFDPHRLKNIIQWQ